MRKVFIDCGGHKGQSVRYFKETFRNADDYEIHSFEPNTQLHELLKRYGGKVYKEAVTTVDGRIPFYTAHQSQGATTVLGKKTAMIDYDNPVKVPSVDLSKWIMDNFKIEDYIVLKLNIEGAEYEILKKMIRDGSIHFIDELYVEFHSTKIDGMQEEEDSIRKVLGKRILDWVILPNS